MALKAYDAKGEKETVEVVDILATEKLERMSKAALARGREKFLGCLYHCHRHYPKVAIAMMPKFKGTLRQETGVQVR